MSRGVVAVDRIAALVVGLVLIALGVVTLAWWGGWGGFLTGRLDLGPVSSVLTQAWWPWALGAAGVALILLGLRWLAAHLPDRGIAQLTLPGSAPGGRLHVDVKPLANACAHEFEGTPGVRSARATIHRDRGELVARVDATLEHEANLSHVAESADRVSSHLRDAIQRDDVRCRVQLTVAQRPRRARRVR